MTQPTKYILGLDIGGTHLRLGLVDEANQLSAFEMLSTRDTFKQGCDPMQTLEECIRSYCKRNMGGSMPVAVSIGFPSTINRTRTIVLQTPNISCIPDHFEVVSHLETSLGIPVYINRDVNNLFLYDINDHNVADCECVCGIYFGTGVGNAVMINGKLLLGKNGVAAELGHIPVHGNQEVCSCGNTGCMESVISGVALERMQQTTFPDTPIDQLFTKHIKHPALKDFLEGMAQVVATEINLFDPDCMILGGGLLQMADFPYDLFEVEIHRFARKPYPEKNLDIRYSHPQQDNGIVGAAIYARNRMADAKYI